MPINSLAITLPVSPEIKRNNQEKRTDDSHPLQATKELAEPMDKLNQTTGGNSDEKDDLQQIKGIGRANAIALNSTGVYSYADLAKFTPESLAELLQEKGFSISPQRIKRANWIGQARVLARGQEEEIDNSQSENDDSAVMPGIENHMQYPTRKSGENWRELGDFFVSFGYAINREGDEQFQTRVHFSQADEFKKWDGLVPDELLNWMLNQAGLSPMKDTEAQSETGVPLVTETTFEGEVFLDLSNLWVSKVKETISMNNQIHTPMLRAACKLSVSGRDTTELTYDRFPYIVEFYLINNQTHRSKLVASYPDQLFPDHLTYEIQQDFPTPTIGEYQLFLIAKLLPPNTAITHLQGPVIRAIP